jgi:lysophospholipase L1-like esterase
VDDASADPDGALRDAAPAPDAAPPVDAAPAPDAAPPVDAALPEPGDPADPVPGVSPYLHLTWGAVAHLQAAYDAQLTHRCEAQIVGDSISESYLFLNPLTTDPAYPDMAYANPTHCRLFGQPSIFLDVLQTAASGMTAEWGLNGDNGWGGVVNLHYPMSYMDLDGGRDALGRRQAWPEIATVMFGTNEMRTYLRDRRSWDDSPDGEAEERAAYLNNLRGIVQWFLDHHVAPVLLTFPPGTYEGYEFTPVGADWGDRSGRMLGDIWADAVRDLGAEMQVPVLDLNRAFTDRADWRALFDDGIHPNQRGYEEVANPAFHAAYQDLRRFVLRR